MPNRFHGHSGFRRSFRPVNYRGQKGAVPLGYQPAGGNDVIRAIMATNLTKEEPQTTFTETYQATNQFADFALGDQLKRNIENKGYTAPTPIQDKTIPAILEGRDIIGVANTGMGKTAAFLIPLVQKVLKDPSQKVLIVVPTRELATQIADELSDFSKGLAIRHTQAIGGLSLWNQKRELALKPQFLIGTPGRLLDLIREKSLFLTDYQTVVLDEADRMVDIGFIGDIQYMISLLPANRQSLFFSATIPPKVNGILSRFVKEPITVSVKKTEIRKNISQELVKVENSSKKVDRLQELLRQEEFEKVLIFCRTKWGVESLTRTLQKQGFNVGAIHGNKTQGQRQRILDQFKSNGISILLATDVASRGLDIDNVSHVINFDVPASYEDYVHRIGRTGRMDKKGVALTFVDS